MYDIRTYQIEIQGQVDEADINAASPREIAIVNADETTTRFCICTDQSGLIGLLRHLNGRGLVLLSVCSNY